MEPRIVYSARDPHFGKEQLFFESTQGGDEPGCDEKEYISKWAYDNSISALKKIHQAGNTRSGKSYESRVAYDTLISLGERL